MAFEEFKIELVADKKKADELYSLCINSEIEFFPLPPVPLENVKNFIEDKRGNLLEITVNDKVYLTLESDKDSAMALLKMIENVDEDMFPLADLPAINLKDFVQGQRQNIANLKIRRNKDVQPKVKPEKPKEKEKAKKADSGPEGD